MCRRSIAVYFILLAGLTMAVPRIGAAQGVQNPPDVLGLKLGMTVQQAIRCLKDIKPDIWLVLGYATEGRNKWPSAGGISPQTDAGKGAEGRIHFTMPRSTSQSSLVLLQLIRHTRKPWDHSARISPLKESTDKETPIDKSFGRVFQPLFYAIPRRREALRCRSPQSLLL